MGSHSIALFFLYGTRAAGTNCEAGPIWVGWSSKKILASNALSISLFWIPPRKKASSIRTFHARSVLITRSCAGALRAVTNSWSSLRIMSIESVMPSSQLILCCPLLLLPPIPPSIRVSSNESTLRMRWPKYWLQHHSFQRTPRTDLL